MSSENEVVVPKFNQQGETEKTNSNQRTKSTVTPTEDQGIRAKQQADQDRSKFGDLKNTERKGDEDPKHEPVKPGMIPEVPPQIYMQKDKGNQKDSVPRDRV